MNYTKRTLNTFILTLMLVTSNILFRVPITQARPSARTIMNTGEVISNLFRRNSDDINIPIPKKIRVRGKSITGIYNRLVQDQNGQTVNVCQAQYSDGSYSEPYYCDQ